MAVQLLSQQLIQHWMGAVCVEETDSAVLDVMELWVREWITVVTVVERIVNVLRLDFIIKLDCNTHIWDCTVFSISSFSPYSYIHTCRGEAIILKLNYPINYNLSGDEKIQSTPLDRVTSVRGHFAPIKQRILLTENALY